MPDWVILGTADGTLTDDPGPGSVSVGVVPGRLGLWVDGPGRPRCGLVLDPGTALRTGLRLVEGSAAALLDDPRRALSVQASSVGVTVDAAAATSLAVAAGLSGTRDLPDGGGEPWGPPPPPEVPVLCQPEPARQMDWPVLLRDIRRTELDLLTSSRDHLPEHGVPFQPYPIPDFVALLTEAVMYATGRQFLDAGCGPGGKMRLAETMFGLDVYGIDLVPGHVDRANAGRAFRAASVADARTWTGYGRYDIVYLNRPAGGPDQDPLERHVTSSMRPGGVLITVNGALDPGRDLGWTVVSAEDGRPPGAPVAGVWQKPVAARM